MPIIAGPDGKRISFPEGTKDEDIAAAFSPVPAAQAKTPPGMAYAKPGPYKTVLPGDQEGQFKNWVQSNHIPFDDGPRSDYDMRGYYKATLAGNPQAKTSINQNDGLPHFPDTFKTPYHQSFSNESMYATPDAPHWANDSQLVDKSGKVVFDEKPNSPKSTPQPAAPTAGQGFLSKAWDWANAPVNIGHMRESIKQAEDYSNAGPTLDEAINHPTRTLIKKGVEGFGADAAKMLLNPLGIAMTALGPAGQGLEAAGVPLAAKAAGLFGTGAGLGFAGQSVADVAQHGVSQQANESDVDYSRRIGGDIAGVALPVLSHGVTHATAKAIAAEPPTGVSTSPAPVGAGDARLAQAVGTPKAEPVQTIHVNPEFADEMSKWNANELPGKRVVLKTAKDGTKQIKLAHTDPEAAGFQYTDTQASNNYSDTPDPALTPVGLWKNNGVRGTNTDGHFLWNRVGGAQSTPVSAPEVPQISPETAQGATAEPSVAVPQPEIPARAARPDSGQNAFQTLQDRKSDENPDQKLAADLDLYHGTSSSNASSIEKDGLKAGPGTFGQVFFAPDEEHARVHAAKAALLKGETGTGIVYKTTLPAGSTVWKFPDAISTGDISADKLSRVPAPEETPLAKAKRKIVSPISPDDIPLKPEPVGGVAPGTVRNQALGIDEPQTILLKMKDGTPFTLQRDFAGKYKAVDQQGNKIGSFGYLKYPDGTWKMSGAEVEPTFKRKGIATAAYDALEKVTGGKFQDTGSQTDAGRAFWDYRREGIKGDKPSVDVSPLEDKIRPLVGKLANLRRLQIGEAASATIDKAIDSTRSMSGSVDPDTADKISKLLGESVGKNLTGDQIQKLEAMRGATGGGEPKVQFLNSATVAARMNDDPAGHQAALDQSMVDMVQALHDPNTTPQMQAKIMKALEPDRNGDPKQVLYVKDPVKYPSPFDTPEDHPESPFTSKQLGHPITPFNDSNARAIFGGAYKDRLRLDSNKDRYVTPEERAEYKQLKSGITTSEGTGDITPEEQAHLDALRTGPDQHGTFDIKDLIGTDAEGEPTGGGSNFGAARAGTSPEFRDFDRELGQKVLSRRVSQMDAELRQTVADWNTQRGPGLTPLIEQLSKLPEETRKLLPEELFSYERSNAGPTGTSSEVSGNPQSVEGTNTTPKKPAPIRAGGPTEIAGLKYTKWDAALKGDAEAQQKLASIRDALKNTPVDVRQKQYARAAQTFHDAFKQEDPFAYKQALDTFLKPNQSGTLNVTGKGSGVYTPEQLNEINASATDKFLERWEKMSDSELLKKKNGLTADRLVDGLEGAVPTSDDPLTRLAQAERYNELKARYDALREKAGPTTNLHDSIIGWMNDFNGPRLDKQAMREVRGTAYRNNAILRNSFDSVDRLMNTLPIPEQDRFFDNMSKGSDQTDELFQAMDPKFIQKWEKEHGAIPDPNDLAKRIRASFDAARDRVTDSSGHLAEFIVNYMPGMYDNQAKSRQFAQSWAARRPLEGSTEFLKQKMYEFHQDALKAGLQPVTSNPVRAMMMRVEQLNRYSMAHEFKNKLVDGGQAQWFNVGETPPEGWEPLNDRIFGQGGQGTYFAPSKVSRTFNNFVSTGLTGSWKVPYTNFSLYDAIKSTNNLANQMQLGFSLFHGVETTMNSAFTTYANGLRQVINEGMDSSRGAGDRAVAVTKGVGNIAKASTLIGPLIEDAWNGSKGLVQFRDPTQQLEYRQLGSDLETVNANVRTDPTFRLEQVENLKKAWSQATDDLLPTGQRGLAVAKAAKSLLGVGVEATSAPLMNWLIPRVKIGAFYKMAQQVHEEYAGQPPDVINGELQKAWDSIDNRFGQVNYDNMFLNKTTKDIMSLSVRSPGWNIGTFREVGGGALDLAGSIKNAAQGRGFKISNRTAYTAAMVSGTMFINALYHYIHTGTQPQGADYFFPKDGTKSAQGEDNRVYPKTYVYDAINLYHDPIHTVWHKAAPDISTLADLIQNEDYYHREIRDPGNNPIQNAAATLGYMAHQFIPFSVGNLNEAKLRGTTSSWESYSGILPAPRWTGRSNAENLAYNYFEKTQPAGSKDESQFEKQKTFILLRNQVLQGKVTDDQIQQAIDTGKLNPRMIQYLYKTTTDPQIVTWLKPLRSETQVMNVWHAASNEEKKILLPHVIQKISTLSTGEEQEKYFSELEDFANKQ